MTARSFALRTRFAVLAVLSLTAPLPAFAQTLPLPPSATVTATATRPADTLMLATGPFTATSGTPQRSFAGTVSQTAYRLTAPVPSTYNLLAPLRDTLLADGFEILFTCDTAACGGFDFRYDLPLLPEPAMHVDLGDFRYLAAIRTAGSASEQAVMIIVSRSSNAGFVQVNHVGRADAGAFAAVPAPAPATPATPVAPAAAPPVISLATPATPAQTTATPALRGDLGRRLETGGAIALDDLVFPSGTATLAPGSYASLAALADYLAANANRQIALVGHTDASGGLDGNIALSRRRAEAVRRALIDGYGAAPAQVLAEGVGFLSPRASNLTELGRAANRRVEVMLTSTQ
jgi:outer membrane protein OmpA-like peptidoglycan-associated protein